MGKAFVAVADDGNALFMNPAGLGTLTKWDLASMNTTFMDEFQYLVLGVAYPTNNGTYGFGYVSTKVGQIPYTGGATGETVDFENSVLLVSYSKYIGDYLYDWLGKEEEIYGGINLKLLGKGFTGAVSAYGTGINIDLGLKYTPIDNEWITYGLNIQNALPSFLGGTIGGGIEEEQIPTVVKAGVAFNVINENILVAIDKDMYFTRAVPWPTHIGAEWKVAKNMKLRGGLDQTIGADSGVLATNPSLGIGLNLNGFSLDFAYRVDFEKTGSSSNFLSFTLKGKPMEEIKKRKKRARMRKVPKKVVVSHKPVIEKVTMTLPKDRQYTFFPKIRIVGSVEVDVVSLKLKDKKVNIKDDLKFDDYGSLKIGKNRLIFTIRDFKGKKQDFERRIVRFYAPQGLSRSEVNKKPLDYKISTTLISDYIGREYRYNEKINRTALAVILSKSQHYKLPVLFKSVSSDITRQYWAAQHIKAVLDKKLMNLYRDNTFRPNYYVTRSEFIRVMNKLTKVKTSKLEKLLLSDELNKEATMGDLISIMYGTGTLRKGIDDYLAFLGISGDVVKPVAASKAEQLSDKYLKINSPADKIVTFSPFVKVSGSISSPSVDRVEINGKKLRFRRGKFKEEVTLNMGKNRVIVDAFMKDGKTETIKRRILRAALPFDAVFGQRSKLEAKPSEYKVAVLVMADYMKGYQSLDTKPEKKYFSKVIYDLKKFSGRAPSKAVAADVDQKHPQAKEIDTMIKTGALKVDSKGKFNPNSRMNRSEMLEGVAIIQGYDLSAAAQFFDSDKDLSDDATMEDFIQLCWKSGLIKDKVAKYLDWESY